jgi:hypothetical protein
VRLYAIRGIRRTAGVEPFSAALALPIGISPPEGCARLSLYAGYLLVLFQQCCQPIRFLYACVKLRILPGKIIAFRCVAATLTVLTNFTSERVVRPCDVEAALANSAICVVSYFQDVPFRKPVCQRSGSSTGVAFLNARVS